MTDSTTEFDEKMALKMENQAANSQGQASSSGDGKKITLLSLHDDVFQEILSHLSYDEIAKLRLVGRHFNEVCQKILNKGFLSVQRYHNRCLKEMKAKLPRRESERRTHPLARHIDVLTGIETRLSLLSMTYYKYTVIGVFCFIPGKVLDECYRVLREVVVHKNPPKSYELLQELRDISSMAMEHFEEHIVPTMKRNQLISTAIRNNSPRFIRCLADADDSDSESTLPSPSSSSCPPIASVASRTLNSFVRSSCASSPSSSPNSSLPSNLKLELAVQQNRLMINNQRRQIIDLKTKNTEYGRKFSEQDRLLSEYSRKLIQLEQKVSNNIETERVHVPTVVTPPPSGRKRPIKEVESSIAEEPPVVKRKILKAVIRTKKPVTVRAKKPVTAGAEKPETVGDKNPETAGAKKPVTVRAKKPVTAGAEKPVTAGAEKPVVVRAKKPVVVRAKKPVVVRAKKPVVVRAKKPVAVIAKNPATVGESPVVKRKVLKAVRAKKSATVQVEKPVVVKVVKPVKVKVVKPVAAKVEKPMAVKVEKSEVTNYPMLLRSRDNSN